MAVAYAMYWDETHRGGSVEHAIKELMRIAIAGLLVCGFCADQRSVMAVDAGLDEEDTLACALPEFEHRDPRTRAALRYARALVLDSPAMMASLRRRSVPGTGPSARRGSGCARPASGTGRLCAA
jgi:AhpD family alkylhydroperoxidase